MEKLIVRELEQKIVPWLDSPHILAIRGPRQCGKTTFLQQLKNILLQNGINEEEIHFISFEDTLEVEKFTKNPQEYLNYYKRRGEEKHFFLLDEVQYVKNAGKLLKLVYDTLEKIKIIITGSSTLDLNEISSYLVGRVLLFEMYPFSFAEFLKTKEENIYQHYLNFKIDLNNFSFRKESSLFLDKLNLYLKEYIIYGGYPAVVLEAEVEKKKFLLKNLFQTYIEKDIVKVYGLRYRQRVLDLIRHLSAINTKIVNYDELSTLTSIYNKEIKEILAVLEDTYIISLIRPFHQNLTTELRKNPKVYFIDTGLRNFITGRFEFGDEEYGQLLENYVLGKLRESKVNYWRTTAKAEVDFVLAEKIPIEVKINPKVTRSFRSFIDIYHPTFAFLVNLEKYEIIKINSTVINVVPLAFL